MIPDRMMDEPLAYKLHYSSVAHLSSQFKKVTGQTASQYRRRKLQRSNATHTIPTYSNTSPTY